jgi:hypothetical protein
MSDFSNEIEISGGGFSDILESSSSDFVNIGDFGVITIDIGFGDGGFGDGPYGGYSTTIIDGSPTIWTNIETP